MAKSANILAEGAICPPSTQFAVYNKITAKKDVVVYFDYGHEGLPGMIDRVFGFWLANEDQGWGLAFAQIRVSLDVFRLEPFKKAAPEIIDYYKPGAKIHEPEDDFVHSIRHKHVEMVLKKAMENRSVNSRDKQHSPKEIAAVGATMHRKFSESAEQEP